MALSIDPATKVISVLQADLTFVSGDLYELDTDAFRKEVNDILSSEDYAWMDDAYDHNAEYTVIGVTYARKVELVNGYSVTFEDNVYSVRMSGSNNNIFDVEGGILNPSGNVTVVGQNSAGLIVSDLADITTTLALVRDIHGQMVRCIFIDTENVSNGNGYQQTPYNNFTDAVDDAEANVLRTLFLEADATVDRQLKGFTINGLGFPTIDLNGQIMDNTVLTGMSVTGTQGVGTGQLLVTDANFLNIQEFDGAALTVSAIGTIEFKDGTVSLINQLIPFVAGGAVTLDLNTAVAAASTVAIQNASGSFIVTNMDQAGDSIHITIAQGSVTIDSSCTAGTVVVAGQAKITDNSAGATVSLDANIDPRGAKEIHTRLGLNPSNAITDTTASIDSASGDIEITRTGDGTTTSTLTRQP